MRACVQSVRRGGERAAGACPDAPPLKPQHLTPAGISKCYILDSGANGTQVLQTDGISILGLFESQVGAPASAVAAGACLCICPCVRATARACVRRRVGRYL